jgi:hypothetical protein
LVEERDNGEFAGLARLSRVGLEKVFGSLVLGGSLVDGRWFTGAPVAALVLLALIAAAWTAIVVSGMRWEHWVGVGYALCASLLAGFTALGPIAIAVPGGFTLLPDRYSVLPIAAVLVGLVCAQPSIPSLKYARIALLVVVLVMRVTDFTVPARPTTHWGSAVECLEDPENECLVDLNPDGWTVTIPAGVR